MKVIILKHVPFEDVGSMKNWLQLHNADINYVNFYEPSAQLPSAQDIDLVIAMGGPMSVNDEEKYPWLIAEKQFLRDVIKNDTAVLGICLGAQLIASALGAKVKRNEHVEIGWFKLNNIDNDSSHFCFPQAMPLLHWHGETFEIPDGARHLAYSEACSNQAFQIGSHVIGMQFHPEITKQTINDLLELCADELVVGDYVQSANAIASAPDELYAQGHLLMDKILDYLLISKWAKTNNIESDKLGQY